ncbi:MAG: tripartite tricarboxylate transporter substrate binding protein [Comamonas sp.]|uniref:Bug family tripartite tricarboxylate transporter substrate binding protein n=1 Tax=Comamonas sp. TaxID=34028 RepID=UPI002FCC757E
MTITTRASFMSARLCTLVLGTAVFAVAMASAHGQTNYPVKPIRLLVPFPPGGGTDMIARSVAQKITEKTSWNIVVDNRPGAGGNLGVDAAAKAAPDGYTLVMGQTSNLAINPALYKKLPYDPLKDLTPVALVSSSPVLIVSGAGTPFNSIAEVFKVAKAKPDVITVGYAGNGTVAHLAVTQVEQATGVKLRHIPYKGIAQAITDLSGGQIDLFVGSIPSLIGQVRNEKLHPLMVTSKLRAGQLPSTPTMAESGSKDFEAITWFGILAPAGTPDAIVQKLNKAINSALSEPDVAEKLRSEGGDVLGGSAEAFGKLMQAEVPRWAKIVKDSGASLN